MEPRPVGSCCTAIDTGHMYNSKLIRTKKRDYSTNGLHPTFFFFETFQHCQESPIISTCIFLKFSQADEKHSPVGLLIDGHSFSKKIFLYSLMFAVPPTYPRSISALLHCEQYFTITIQKQPLSTQQHLITLRFGILGLLRAW